MTYRREADDRLPAFFEGPDGAHDSLMTSIALPAARTAPFPSVGDAERGIGRRPSRGHVAMLFEPAPRFGARLAAADRSPTTRTC